MVETLHVPDQIIAILSLKIISLSQIVSICVKENAETFHLKNRYKFCTSAKQKGEQDYEYGQLHHQITGSLAKGRTIGAK